MLCGETWQPKMSCRKEEKVRRLKNADGIANEALETEA